MATMSTTTADQTASPELAHVTQVSQEKLSSSPIYGWVLDGVEFISASKGHAVARLQLSERHINSKNGMHGSLSLTLIDWMGGMALTTYDLRSSTGVSLDIHVSFQSSAKLGETIEIEGIVDRLGRTVAFTKVNIYKVEGCARGGLLVSGSHSKYVK